MIGRSSNFFLPVKNLSTHRAFKRVSIPSVSTLPLLPLSTRSSARRTELFPASLSPIKIFILSLKLISKSSNFLKLDKRIFFMVFGYP